MITGVSDDSRLMKEEVFGPVTCVVPFKTEEEVYYTLCMDIQVYSSYSVRCVYIQLQS